MALYIVRNWNLAIIGAIKATGASEAQEAWEAQAGNGALVLATRITAERSASIDAQIDAMIEGVA